VKLKLISAKLGAERKLQKKEIEAWSKDYRSGHVIAEHNHVRGQLLFAESGVMRLKTRTGAWIVPPSRAIWIPARVRHEVRMASAVRMRTLYVHPDAGFSFPSNCQLVEVSALLRELILAGVNIVSERKRGNGLKKILALIEEEVKSSREIALHVPFPKDARLKPICEALLQKPSIRENLRLWARKSSLSERTLLRLFQQEMGVSYRYWRQQVVLSEAISLLERGISVNRVSRKLGYRSVSAFSLMFHQALGLRPGHFLQNGKS
jgi:AraC-like DNA-binding protein/mannose-6-phosphate isomerase-like protein (cupin superfamily)